MSTKIFPHRPRKIRSAPPHLAAAHEDPEKQRARIAAERRERERIAADRQRRMLERSVARAVTPKDQSDRDAEWFAAHPGRDHRVRRKIDGEFPTRIDSDHWRWVAVRQVAPGMRFRLTFNVPQGRRKFLEYAATEEGARTIFEMVISDHNAQAVDTWPGAATG